MATYDLDRIELNHLLTPNIDPSVRTAVLDYLYKDIDSHFPDHDREHKLDGQISDATEALNPQADVLVLTSADNSVTTDANLKAIIENVATDSTLDVSGTHSVFIAM